MRSGILQTGNLRSDTVRMPTLHTRPSHRRGLFFVMFQEKEISRKRPRRETANVKIVSTKKNVVRLKRTVTKVGRSVSMVKNKVK